MEDKNKRKFSARGVVAFLAFWLLVGSFFFIFQTCTEAIEPMPTSPSESYGVILDANYITDSDLQFILAVYNSQYRYGGFDSFTPLILYRSGSSLRLCFTNGSLPYDLETSYSYDGAGQLNLSVALGQSVRFLMTEYGFKSYVVGQVPATLAYEDVIFYRDPSGVWVDNSENFATVQQGDGQGIAYTAYSRWLQWLSQLPPEGGDGDQIIVNELDIGSIISSLPQAARNIIDGALGFEIFGINVAGTLTAILVVAIVGFVVRWLLSLKS